MTTIYLSSTYEDLKDHRKKVHNALVAAGYRVIAMEHYVAKDKRPVDDCLADVAKSDIYVGIFGMRYGYVPPPEHNNPDGLSITELELRQAESQDHTWCITFLLNPDGPQPPQKFIDALSNKMHAPKIERLRASLRREKEAPYFDFGNPDQLANLVQQAITNHLEAYAGGAADRATGPPPITWDVEEKEGPPYPGLLHFTPEYAPVFFGRDAEIREVIDRLSEPWGHFVIVSGGSGSGKSSLVHAAVLPELDERGLGDQSVEWAYMLPSNGVDCFDAITRALEAQQQRTGQQSFETGRALAAAQPAAVAEILDKIASRGGRADILMLFVDQMEELFAAGSDSKDLATPFLTGLHAASSKGHLRVIATIRNDQLGPLYDHPSMLSVLNSPAHFGLGPVPAYALDDVIVRPAGCAGVAVPPGLVRKLIEDIGRDSGSLPLLAFALRRLFEQVEDGTMREDLYDQWGGKDLGRLQGAIAEHAREAEAHLAKDQRLDEKALKARLASIFPKLVRVDVEGTPLRLRPSITDLPNDQKTIVSALSGKDVRLLVTDLQQVSRPDADEEKNVVTVSIAHEKLLSAWPTLAAWVDENRGELITLRRAEVDARDWSMHAYDPEHLWSPRRLSKLKGIMEKLPDKPISDITQSFAAPQKTLIQRLEGIDLSHKNRERIGEYLTELGDPRDGVGLTKAGVPDIDWIDIKGGAVKLEGGAGKKRVADFRISRYPITNTQFQAFVDDGAGGYRNKDWWRDMPPEADQDPSPPNWSEGSAPRETVSWYEAVAFCRWLSARLPFNVSLPTEFEWQRAATNGRRRNSYPWGKDFDARLCNSSESNLNRTTVVGLYPAGTWRAERQTGPMDMAGNVWEWCLNKWDSPDDAGVDASRDSRVLRGGSWDGGPDDLRASSRYWFDPGGRGHYVGFRVVCRPPSSTNH